MAEGSPFSVPPIPSSRHDEEIHFNRAAWERKPCLRKIYRDFHQKIRAHLTPIPDKLIVEIGSGMGSIKETIPDCVTSDIFPNPWLDRRENAYALSFPSHSLSNLILFDVWHHLQYPGSALREFARVLTDGGRVILFEPAMSLVGRFVYSNFHHEPTGWKTSVRWDAPEEFDPESAPYFAAQSLATRVFLNKEFSQWTGQWRLVATELVCSFSYLLSGGFRGPQVYPDSCLPLLESVDRSLNTLPGLFAARMLIVLEKKS